MPEGGVDCRWRELLGLAEGQVVDVARVAQIGPEATAQARFGGSDFHARRAELGCGFFLTAALGKAQDQELTI